jgi:hypothetical protein
LQIIRADNTPFPLQSSADFAKISASAPGTISNGAAKIIIASRLSSWFWLFDTPYSSSASVIADNFIENDGFDANTAAALCDRLLMM